jgi:hypothetical protein
MDLIHKHTSLIKVMMTCASFLFCFAQSQAIIAADEMMPVQKGTPLKRLIKRISSTRESVILSAACDTGTLALKKGEASCTQCPSYTGKPGDAGGFRLDGIITG